MFEAIKEFAIDKVKFALDTDDKNVREERLAPVIEEIHAQFDEQYPEKQQRLTSASINCRNSLSEDGCSTRANVWMVVASTKSVRWQLRLV